MNGKDLPGRPYGHDSSWTSQSGSRMEMGSFGIGKI